MHLDNVKNIKIGNAMREILTDRFGFVALVVDLVEGHISIISDAPSQELVQSTIELAQLNLKEAKGFFLDPNQDRLN